METPRSILNAKINGAKNKLPDITNLASNTTLTPVENKTPEHSKYITTPEFKKLTVNTFYCKIKTSKCSN